MVRAEKNGRPWDSLREPEAAKTEGAMMANSSKTETSKQLHASTIRVDRFQPFESRLGTDDVVRLRFAYDPALVSRLKAILAVHAVGTRHKSIGGWLPKHSCWFVEPSVWDVVRMELLYLGHRVLEAKP